ncbi:ATP-binding cassette domain-containing protein [Aliikangiella coralliicola]|uniref:Probable ATP-binding protein YheS n=1 Tax=Aliikangiella coralliicola TaxID=2592383 RepID=A0A545UFZ3_9GAMM|nr:ATP-binding cassette domain-containing protein [Aliikangiella coralliicola]TQV88396.1 ATP-binding cassette domain-containing protein [Aliikangiella coralliicola]
MIRFKKLSLFQGNKQLLNQIDLTLYPDQKIGIVGKNGCGKSSLFQMVQHELAPEHGELEFPSKWRTSSAKQETPGSDLTAIDYVLSGHQEYAQLHRALTKAEHNEDGHAIASIHAKLEAINGWSLPAEAAKLLTGLSFTEAQMASTVKSLSGGWRMRLNLAQALIQPAELLLLDEPTNHLDLEAVLWLQGFLRRYDGMLMTISHDRDFLDNFCSHILHFDSQKINQYTGNYSSFEKQKQEREVLQQAQFEKQQKEIEHLEKFITRFKAKASKATQAQSRVKALEKMDKVSAVQIRTKFGFEFAPINKNVTELINIEQGSVGYDDTIVLADIRMRILAGQRIGLLGRNGEGKSTLIKLICGELAIRHGELNRNKHFNAGYFAQHQVEQLNLDQSPIWHIQSLGTGISEQEARNFLGGFAFHGDKTLDKVKGFSGGEKARLVLAMITWQKPNLLLLDEPTNHFDIEMREALSLALQDFDGAVLLVAHDKNLMESVVDEFWLVNEGKVEPFSGDLNDYQKWLNDNRWGSNAKNTDDVSDAKVNSAQAKKEQKRLEAARRQQKAPLTNRLKKIDKQMLQLQQEHSNLENQLSDNDLYNDENKAKLNDVVTRSNQVKNDLEKLEEEWLEVSEQLEAFE